MAGERVWRTKRGRRMLAAIRKRIVEVLGHPAHGGLHQDVLAERAGVSVRTFRDYLTEELMAEVCLVRATQVVETDLMAVDRAMLEKALQGHVGAARLLYARVAGLRLSG